MGSEKEKQNDLTYDAQPFYLLRRKECDPNNRISKLLRNMLAQVPNKHLSEQYRDYKQRTPNLTVDNICFFLKNGEIHVLLGFFNKTVSINGVNQQLCGWTLSGGHVEYNLDMTCEEAALRELEEEFGIKKESIIKRFPIAAVDDFLRDKRNEYFSIVYLNWINCYPKPSNEHKSIAIVSIADLQKMIAGELTIAPNQETKQTYGLVLGHDEILKSVLELAPTKELLSDITYSK